MRDRDERKGNNTFISYFSTHNIYAASWFLMKKKKRNATDSDGRGNQSA